MRNRLTIRGGYNTSRDPAISIIRVLAFLSIITCHIMQYYHCELAWWFNVGVQIFLCLSGYLYGRKSIDNELSFYKKQFIKILIPYYLVVIIAIIAQVIFVRNEISGARIVKTLLCYGTLNGGEHLWFVPTILFCYLLTPLFDKINDRIFTKKYPLFYCLTAFVILSVIIKLFTPYFNPAWIVCFYLGHVLGKNENKKGINPILCKGLIYVGTVCLVSIQIGVMYLLKLEFTGAKRTLFHIMCDYGHTFLGISIVLILIDVFRGRNIPHFIMKQIAFLDSISYEGYLVHQFFIFGAFSLFAIIGQPIIAVIVILSTIFAFGFFIKLVSEKMKRLIK